MMMRLTKAYRDLKQSVKHSLSAVEILFPAEQIIREMQRLERAEKASVASKTGQLSLVHEWKAMTRRGETRLRPAECVKA
jgi:hypothetical protein